MGFGTCILDCLIAGSDFANMMSYAIVLNYLVTKRSCEGLSLQSLFCLVATRVQHIFSHALDLHYTPQFLPSFVYGFLDFSSMMLGIGCAVLIKQKYMDTYDATADDFGVILLDRLGGRRRGKRRPAKWAVLYVLSFVLAFLWYQVRRTMSSFWTGYFCCFYEVICSVALIPQLWMFHKQRAVNRLLGNFVVCVAVNRLCILAFWVMYPSFNYGRKPDNRGVQMASESLNLLIAADFLFYYARSMLQGDDDIVLGDFSTRV
jgi:hypothetical protein